MRRVLSTALALAAVSSLGLPQESQWRPFLAVEFDLVERGFVEAFGSEAEEVAWETVVASDLQAALLHQLPFHAETATTVEVVLDSEGDGDLRATYLQVVLEPALATSKYKPQSLPRWQFRSAEDYRKPVGKHVDFRNEIKRSFETHLGDAGALVSGHLSKIPVGRRVRLYPQPVANKCALPFALSGAQPEELVTIFQFGTVQVTDGGLTTLNVKHFVEGTPGKHSDPAGGFWDAIVAQDVEREITLADVSYEHHAVALIPEDLGEVQENNARDMETDLFLRRVAFKVPRVKPEREFEPTASR